jgi:hypothetical protein
VNDLEVVQPFVADEAEVLADPDKFVDTVVAEIESEFLTLPRGEGFVDYPSFDAAYEELKRQTRAFEDLSVDALRAAVEARLLCFVVVRAMLGFTPPEWAEVATERTGFLVTQQAARTLDRDIRKRPGYLPSQRVQWPRIDAMLQAASEILQEGAPETAAELIHRLDKADTQSGPLTIRQLANLGVPYSMLLYERFLGRQFAGHRDSISELVGEVLEAAIEDLLCSHGISYRKTARAEKLQGFDQAPDFLIPNEFNPSIVIEAKLASDDGTARDKVTRIQHLDEIRKEREAAGNGGFQVIACVGGRGFKIRREDMRKILQATRGKVFTPLTLQHMVSNTRLQEFVTKAPSTPAA